MTKKVDELVGEAKMGGGRQAVHWWERKVEELNSEELQEMKASWNEFLENLTMAQKIKASSPTEGIFSSDELVGEAKPACSSQAVHWWEKKVEELNSEELQEMKAAWNELLENLTMAQQINASSLAKGIFSSDELVGEAKPACGSQVVHWWERKLEELDLEELQEMKAAWKELLKKLTISQQKKAISSTEGIFPFSDDGASGPRTTRVSELYGGYVPLLDPARASDVGSHGGALPHESNDDAKASGSQSNAEARGKGKVLM